MVEGCGLKCCKYLLFVCNLIFFLCGIALIVVGSIAISQIKKAGFGGAGSPITVFGVIVGIGVVIVIITFFGVFGAIRESRCMLVTFAVLLGIIFVLLLACAILSFIYAPKVYSQIKNHLNSTISYYGRAGDQKYNDTSFMFDFLQTKFKCCGLDNDTDWEDAQKRGANLKVDSVPDSCCKEVKPECGFDQLKNSQSATIYHNGCGPMIKAFLKKNMFLIGGIVLGIAFILIIGIVMACCLCTAVKKQYEVA